MENIDGVDSKMGEQTVSIIHLGMSTDGGKYFLIILSCFQKVWTLTECPQEAGVPNNNLLFFVYVFVLCIKCHCVSATRHISPQRQS